MFRPTAHTWDIIELIAEKYNVSDGVEIDRDLDFVNGPPELEHFFTRLSCVDLEAEDEIYIANLCHNLSCRSRDELIGNLVPPEYLKQ